MSVVEPPAGPEAAAPFAAAPAAVTRVGPYPWYVIGVLMLIYTSSFIDRTVIALLVGPIRRDLHISDTQMSLLSGLSFAILYTSLGVPIGRLADRRSRRVIIACGVAAWSVMTAACGLAKNFTQLFLARVGVGVGEASLTPAAYSLIADYFPKERLAGALGVYNMGIGLGSGLALYLGGLVIGAVAKAPPVVLPVFGPMHAWQLTFLIVALPGAFLTLLMATVREPVRRGLMATTTGGAERPSFRQAVGYIWARKDLYGPLYAGYSLYALVNFGFAAWIPSCLIRSYGWTAAQAGQRYGLVVLALGVLGSLAGGWFADRRLRNGDRGAYIRTTILAGCGVLPCSLLAPLTPDATASLALFGGAVFFNSAWLGVCGGSIQLTTPNQLRGQATALMFLFSSMIGFGLGPLLIASITDAVFHDDAALRWSLAIVAAVAMPLALGVFALGRRRFVQAVEAMEVA